MLSAQELDIHVHVEGMLRVCSSLVVEIRGQPLS